MGCLNSEGQFEHWFGNIHLSGPCNRACYFCIGQHMMALDPLNVLDAWPLPGLDDFVAACKEAGVTEINVTGSNTDPLLYRHTAALREYLDEHFPDLTLGLRTNGVLALARPEIMERYDKGSVTVCSFNPTLYRRMMGQGDPPDLEAIMEAYPRFAQGLKVNVVLGPPVIETDDIFHTLNHLAALGIKTVNLREPYGQPHVGDPMQQSWLGLVPTTMTYGMPTYDVEGMAVTYWDVHYCEVESVNLYANGHVSHTYPVTKGHDFDQGEVRDQRNFYGGRIREQWVDYPELVTDKK